MGEKALPGSGALPGGITMMKDINCPDCKPELGKINAWLEVCTLGLMPGLMSKSGKRQVVKYPVWRCSACGHILSEHDLDVVELSRVERKGQ